MVPSQYHRYLIFRRPKKKDAEFDPSHIVEVGFDLAPPEGGPTPREKSEKRHFRQFNVIPETQFHYVVVYYGMFHNS